MTCTVADDAIVVFRLVLGLEFGAAHRIDALRVQWVLHTEVCLCKFLAFTVGFNRGAIVAQFFVLFSHT